MLYYHTLRLIIKKQHFFKFSASLKSVIYPSLPRIFSYFAFKKIKKNLVVFKNFVLLPKKTIKSHHECLKIIYQRHLSDKP